MRQGNERSNCGRGGEGHALDIACMEDEGLNRLPWIRRTVKRIGMANVFFRHFHGRY